MRITTGHVSRFLAKVDNTVDLIKAIRTAVGSNGYINPDITPERFKRGEGVREVYLELAPFLDGETGEQAAKRLVDDGYTLEGVGELTQFLADNPDEVGKYTWVVALNKASRWVHPGGSVLVPGVYAGILPNSFSLHRFSDQFRLDFCVLVSRSSK